MYRSYSESLLLYRSESHFEIGDEIVDILDPYGKANEIGCDPQGRSGLVWKALFLISRERGLYPINSPNASSRKEPRPSFPPRQDSPQGLSISN